MTTEDRNRGLAVNADRADARILDAAAAGIGEPEISSELLDAATQALRDDHVDDRWVQVRDRVFAHAVSFSRRSRPVRAQAPGGPVFISEHILVTELQQALNSINGLALEHVTFDLIANEYRGVELVVIVQYGQRIITLADRARELAVRRLTRLLGPVIPPVTVTTMVVHVSDVSVDDPASG